MQRMLSFLTILSFCIVWPKITLGSEQVEFIDSEDLPNADNSENPQEVSIRIKALLEQIESLSDLTTVHEQDLNRLDVQTAIFEKNPYLILKFPTSVTLLKEPTEKLAKKTYRFDFFVPQSLRKQAPVTEAFNKFKRPYIQYRDRFLLDSITYLLEGEGLKLIHPDSFYNTTFTTLFFQQCSSLFNNTGNYGMHFRPPFPHHEFPGSQFPQNSMNRSKKANKIDSFYYFNRVGVFDSQHKEVFLKKHPRSKLPIECYPIDFLSDESFVEEINKKIPGSTFTSDVYKRTRNPRLKELYLKDFFDSMDKPLGTNRIGELTEDELNTEIGKNWLISNPYYLKNISIKLLSANKLEDIIKTLYKPSAYFTDIQKNDPDLVSILNKYPNDSNEMLSKILETNLERLKSTDPHRHAYKKYVESLPLELRNDKELILSQLNTVSKKPELLQAFAEINGLPKQLEDHLISSCKNEIWIKTYAIFYIGHERKNSEFTKKLKEACEVKQ